tara:strand:+ start:29663 stop:31240 length:1578 start_codon:yes stop_codon:yes gene_type:complete
MPAKPAATAPSHRAPAPDAIPTPKPRRLGLILCAAVALVTVAILAVSGGASLRPTPMVAVRPVLLAQSDEPAPGAPDAPDRPAARTVQAPGWLEADPYLIACTALTDGVLAAITVLEGESVQAGQTVARLVDEDARLALARADAELAVAKAAHATAQAALAAARTDWNEPVERQRAVRTAEAARDQIAAQIDQLPSLIAAAQARVEQLAEELERVRQAFRSNAASEIETVVAEKLLQGARATAESLRKRGAILRAELAGAQAELAAATRMAELRTAERLALDAAEAGLTQAGALIAQRQAARDEAALRLERTNITAPITGFVQRRLKAPGDKVLAGMDDPYSAHILHLYDPGKIQVRVDVPLADAAQISVGQRCEVVVEILPDRVFAGEVTRVTHEADLQKNTLQAKVRVIDPDPLLRPEMLTRVRFIGGASDDAASPSAPTARTLLIPESALVSSNGADAVRSVHARRAGKGRLHTVPVTVLARADGFASINADLSPGDLVAVGPAANIAEGARVRFTTPEANQ